MCVSLRDIAQFADISAILPLIDFRYLVGVELAHYLEHTNLSFVLTQRYASTYLRRRNISASSVYVPPL